MRKSDIGSLSQLRASNFFRRFATVDAYIRQLFHCLYNDTLVTNGLNRKLSSTPGTG